MSSVRSVTKRRCAGCNRVFSGRPNKRYCSEGCADAAKKRRKRGDNVSPLSGAVPSVIRGSNGVLIATVAQLGYLGDKDDLIFEELRVIGYHVVRHSAQSDGLNLPPGA
jgi:hypothetical protein